MKKGLSAKINGNDIIIDELYKVISYASINVGDRIIYTCVHISMNANIEHIKNICRKSMSKIPKGLNYYNVYDYEILNILKNNL